MLLASPIGSRALSILSRGLWLLPAEKDDMRVVRFIVRIFMSYREDPMGRYRQGNGSFLERKGTPIEPWERYERLSTFHPGEPRRGYYDEEFSLLHQRGL